MSVSQPRKHQVIIIDNFDSFVFNLKRMVHELGFDCQLYRNNQISVTDLIKKNPTHIILSPGPGHPDAAGICIELIQKMLAQVSILGVCLGHQAIAAALGGQIIRAQQPMHGRASVITHDQHALFAGIPQSFTVGRYHSLIVDRQQLPKTLYTTAQSELGEIMGISHVHYPVHGVQFHPESILSEMGDRLLANFLQT